MERCNICIIHASLNLRKNKDILIRKGKSTSPYYTECIMEKMTKRNGVKGDPGTESGVTKWVNGVRFFDYALRLRSE